MDASFLKPDPAPSSWSRQPRARRRRSGGGGGYYPRAHAITDPALISSADKANSLIKRLFDIGAALSGLVLLSPILITASLFIWLQDRGPILYGHKRVGRKGRHFRCWKFRSMVRHGDEVLRAYLEAHPAAKAEWERTQKLANDPRVTRIGAFIRKTSIDELPQLWNVLIGEMSIIGPRPITRPELDRYGPDRRYYLLVRPGITGLWQVSGRSNTSYERRIALDRQYLENWSYKQDITILMRTPLAVLRSDGAS
jgi:Undecaprenyl-phosphate galactose phosphotransferase WbaP